MTLEELLAKVVDLRPKIQGWCSDEKAIALVEAIVQRRPEVVVEIGVFGGSSLIPQALAVKNNGIGHVYGIDPWTVDAALEEMRSDQNRDWWRTINFESIYQHCHGHLVAQGLTGVCTLLRDKAENVVDRFADESVDMLHIDGNHSELLAYRDAQLYLPKVKPGGLIVFDDIWWTDGGDEATTRKAIVHLQTHCTKLRLVGKDCMLLQKDG